MGCRSTEDKALNGAGVLVPTFLFSFTDGARVILSDKIFLPDEVVQQG
jgi:hypothetical protein